MTVGLDDINYYGERLDDDYLERNLSRVETFSIADDEQLIGCELDEKIKWFVKLKSHGLIDES